MEKFHKMELEYKLFDLGKEINYPFWDMIRASIYSKYINGYDDSFRVMGQSLLKSLFLFLEGFRILFTRGRVIFFTLPRDVNEKGRSYDKIANQLIALTHSSKRVVVNCITPISREEYKGFSIILVLHLLRLFVKCPAPNLSEMEQIQVAMHDHFDIMVPIDELKFLYQANYLQLIAFKRLFACIKPSKVICSIDQQKSVYWAAKRYNIPSFELQHAGIVFEYPSYSYPKGINRNDNVSFAENYVMFGPDWGRDNNIPCNRMVLGNDYFIPSHFDNFINRPYIVIISDQDHVGIITRICEDLSVLVPDILIIFKLHPIQYTNMAFFETKFVKFKNVKVVTSEYQMPSLLKHMLLMVTVYSSVFFEAMSLGKKVAVIKDDIYYLLLPYMVDNQNACLVSSAEEIRSFIGTPEYKNHVSFYVPFNRMIGEMIIN